jgi:hypothetical protein
MSTNWDQRAKWVACYVLEQNRSLSTTSCNGGISNSDITNGVEGGSEQNWRSSAPDTSLCAFSVVCKPRMASFKAGDLPLDEKPERFSKSPWACNECASREGSPSKDAPTFDLGDEADDGRMILLCTGEETVVEGSVSLVCPLSACVGDPSLLSLELAAPMFRVIWRKMFSIPASRSSILSIFVSLCEP